MAPKLEMHGSILTAVLLLTLIANTGSGIGPHEAAGPLGPPYVIDVYYVAAGPIAIDGNLTEPEWTDPSTTVTVTTETLYDWNITISVFHNSSYLFVGVVVDGDDERNPNDVCELAFDVTHNMTTPPENTDMKLRAKNTGVGVDEYSLWYGDEVSPWLKYSDHLDTPNPWPAGFLAVGDYPVIDNMTYEFQIPIVDAWGEAVPPNGNITGLCIHAFGQADNQHVWWPDDSDDNLNPVTQHCNFPNTYGDLVFHSQGDLPDHLEYVAGDDQSGIVDTTLPQMIQMRVLNQTGGNVSGAIVNYTIYSVPGGASGHYFVESGFPWYEAISDAQGVANASLHLGDRPGNYWINASNSALPGLAGPTYNNTLNATALVGPLASIEMSASPGTVQPTGTSALAIWANDTHQNGIDGLTITMSFDANPSGAGLSGVTDNSDGTYSCTYTAGQTAWVTDTVRAASGGQADTVDIVVEAGPAFSISYVSGNGQTNFVELALDEPFVVSVEDQYGNGIPGVNVDWLIVGSPAGASGQILTPGTNATNATGLAGSLLTLGDLPGQYSVNASADVLPGDNVSFSADATYPPLPDDLNITIFSGNNQLDTADSDLPLPLVAQVFDGAVPVRAGVSVWFNVSSGGGHLNGTANRVILTDADGKASANLTLGPLAGTNSVTAEISSTATSQVTFIATGTLPEITPTLAANQTSVVPGGAFSYILSFNNIGTEYAADVWVNDTLPTGVRYVQDSSGIAPQINGSSYSWFFPSLPVAIHSFVLYCGVEAGVAVGSSITNSYSVEYSNQNGAQMPAVTSNVLSLLVAPETIVNVPPVIEGVPDLVVHYDWDYTLDLEPYITDPDTAVANLFLILSDTEHAREHSTQNLVIILNYSQDLVGTIQTLNVTVSDGLGSDWDVIDVLVTDDFPPEIIQALPDVTMEEDSVSYPFNITEYFFDRDGDAVYYTSGEVHIHVEFFTNGTVELTPDTNWYGMERITFRATSGVLGALVEDSITVTVTPVNDPPVILDIEDQTGEVDVSWLLDLSPYISDVDNTPEELTVTTDSESVIVNGLNLTFRFVTAVQSDIVTVTVSDGTDEVYQQIYVTVTASQIQTSDFPIPPWLWPFIILIPIIIGIILAAARRKKVIIEQAFLMYFDGTLLAHVTNRMIPDMDSQLFSAMFTAIQDFVKDSFKDEKKWELKKLEFGDNKIFVDRGKSGFTILALVYKSGTDEQLKNLTYKTLDTVEKDFYVTLEEWDGNMDKMRGTRDILVKKLFK